MLSSSFTASSTLFNSIINFILNLIYEFKWRCLKVPHCWDLCCRNQNFTLIHNKKALQKAEFFKYLFIFHTVSQSHLQDRYTDFYFKFPAALKYVICISTTNWKNYIAAALSYVFWHLGSYQYDIFPLLGIHTLQNNLFSRLYTPLMTLLI